MEHHDIKASCANTLIYVAQCIFCNHRLHWSNSFALLHVSSWRRPTHCSESNQGTGRLVCTHLKHHHHHGRDDKQFEDEVCTHLGNLAWRSPPQSWSHRPMSTCETNCWKSKGSLPSSFIMASQFLFHHHHQDHHHQDHLPSRLFATIPPPESPWQVSVPPLPAQSCFSLNLTPYNDHVDRNDGDDVDISRILANKCLR